MKDVAEKVALITDGAAGIGYALATNFVKDKAKVVLVDIDGESLQKAASQLHEMGGAVYPFVCDGTCLGLTKP